MEFAVRNLQKIVHILKIGLLTSIQSKALKMAVFANGRVWARLKIRHFQGFTVLTGPIIWTQTAQKLFYEVNESGITQAESNV